MQTVARYRVERLALGEPAQDAHSSRPQCRPKAMGQRAIDVRTDVVRHPLLQVASHHAQRQVARAVDLPGERIHLHQRIVTSIPKLNVPAEPAAGAQDRDGRRLAGCHHDGSRPIHPARRS